MNIMQMMKQAQEIQGKIQEVQQQLAETEVEGASGAGLVKVRLNGKGEMRGLEIDPGLVKADEVDVMEDLIIAAHSDAKAKVEALMQQKMQDVTGGLPLPPGMKLF